MIMAIIEIKHTRRLNNFSVNVAPSSIRRGSLNSDDSGDAADEPLVMDEEEEPSFE